MVDKFFWASQTPGNDFNMIIWAIRSNYISESLEEPHD